MSQPVPDLVVQFGVRDFAAPPEWHLILRTLVERLLHEADDPLVRELLNLRKQNTDQTWNSPTSLPEIIQPIKLKLHARPGIRARLPSGPSF